MPRILPIVLFILLLPCQKAGAIDPTLPWKTIETPHFEIHYHAGTRDLAFRIAHIAEAAFGKVAAALEHVPWGRIQLVLNDHSDSANGSASVIPYNLIHALASAPEDLSELNDYDDYMWILILHELVHIVHMDTISGIPAAINWVFGRTVFPNGAQPTWFTEGLAVHLESAHSSAGRIRSSLFRMYLRTAALAGVFPGIDQVSGSMKDWPQGNAPYLYGSFFVEYIARRFGETVLTDLSHTMSGMLVPWTLNIVARREMGTDYITLYRDWKEYVLGQARATLARLEQEGLTPFVPLTRRGQRQQNPRISPGSGQVLYYSAPTNRWPALRLVDKSGKNDRLLTEVNSNGGSAFTPDGRGVVYAQHEVVDQFYVLSDLFHLDLESGRTRRLTEGARARSPDVSPDGRWIVYVHNHAGRTRLMLAGWVPNGPLKAPPRELAAFPDGTQVYAPRFSPSGRQVVFSAAIPGRGRRLVLVEVEDGSKQTLTDDGCMDLQPVFSPDGRRVIFSSDRTGIYNLYALELATRKLTRLTNLATGAFSPDPAQDGSGIAFVVYGKDGFDIAWVDLPVDEQPAVLTREPRGDPPSVDTSAKYPEKSYTPWSSLWPRAWFPIVGSDAWGTTYGAMISGRDAVGKLDYRLELVFSPEKKQVYFDLGLRAQVIYPTLFMYAGRHVYRYYNQAVVNGYTFPVDRERLTLYFDASFPFSSIRESHAVFVNYDLNLYDRWTEIPLGPWDLEPVLPNDGNLAFLGLGWAYSNVRRFVHSISAEEGFSISLSLRYSHPAIGSSAHLAEARVGFRTYFPIIRDLHHVLAFGLQAGYAVGDTKNRPIYSVGGLPVSDPFLDAYYGYRYGGLYLRGYPIGAFAGTMYTLGSLEYRFPVWDIETGVLTLPFYLRRLHAAVFVDVGGAAYDEPSTDLLKVGLGAELRLDMYFAYYLPTTLRVGFARGVSAGGSNNFFLTMGWGF